MLAGDWAAIRTAPTDDRRLLLYEKGHIYIGARRAAYDWWDGEGEYYRGTPTHWRPLPDPPMKETDGQ